MLVRLIMDVVLLCCCLTHITLDSTGLRCYADVTIHASHIQSAQKCHMHINSTRHFIKPTFILTLNLILKYSHINIALLHNKILIL